MSAVARAATGLATASASGFNVAETNGAPQTGDIRYVFTNTSSSSNVSVTAPAGWTTVMPTTTVGAGNLAVFSKPWVAGVGTETFNLSTTAVAVGAMIVAAGGVNQAATPQTATNGSGTAGTTLTTASLTPTFSDGLLFAYFAATQTTTVSSATLSTPAGMTLLNTLTATGTGSGYTILLADAAITSTAAKGPYTSTGNQSATWRTVLLAVPSSATPTGGGNFFRYLGGMNSGFAR